MGVFHEGMGKVSVRVSAGTWDGGLLKDVGCQNVHEWLQQCLRAHLLCRVIILWLPRLVEVQHGVGAQADGADSRVVQWPILVGLGRRH